MWMDQVPHIWGFPKIRGTFWGSQGFWYFGTTLGFPIRLCIRPDIYWYLGCCYLRRDRPCTLPRSPPAVASDLALPVWESSNGSHRSRSRPSQLILCLHMLTPKGIRIGHIRGCRAICNGQMLRGPQNHWRT